MNYDYDFRSRHASAGWGDYVLKAEKVFMTEVLRHLRLPGKVEFNGTVAFEVSGEKAVVAMMDKSYHNPKFAFGIGRKEVQREFDFLVTAEKVAQWVESEIPTG
jgi:hypothetical protein